MNTKNIISYSEIMKDYPDILTPDDVKKILNIGRNNVYKLLADRTIPSLRIGVKYRIPKLSLLELIYPNMTSNDEVN